MRRFGSGRTIPASYYDWPRRPTFDTAVAMYFAAAAGLMGIGLASQLIHSLFPQVSGMALNLTSKLLFQGGLLLAPVACYLSDRPGAARGIRLVPTQSLFLLLAAMAATAAVLFASGLGTLWLLLVEALGGGMPRAGSGADASGFFLVVQLVVSALIPAVCEELLFRGIILSAWERRGTTRALMASSLLFAALHGSFVALPVQFVLGFAIGVSVLASGSLYAGMLFHGVYNALMLVFPAGVALIPGESMLAYLGGAAGVWPLLGRTLVFGAALFSLLAVMWRMGAPTPAPVEQGEGVQWSTSTLIVLSAGIVTVACAYLIDILGIWGVL